MPTTFDCIVKIEDVSLLNNEITITAPIESGEFVREAGEDYGLGDLIASKGTTLRSHHVLAMAALGVQKVCVFEKPRVAIISTGKELVSHSEQALRDGQIRNSTLPYLVNALTSEYGCNVIHACTVSDSEEEFKSKISETLELGTDFILTTGAVSMGTQDYIPRALSDMRANIFFHKTAIRPGKPGLFARLGETGPCIFAVPGNPLSTVVALRFFIDPYLRCLHGKEAEKPVQATLLNTTPKPEGLRCFFKANLKIENAKARVQIREGQASFMIRPLVESDCWVVLPEPNAKVEANALVDVYPLLTTEVFP